MSIALIASGVIVAFTLGVWFGYSRGTNQIRNEAVDRKLASWQKTTIGYDLGPIVIEKFTWVGEEQDGK